MHVFLCGALALDPIGLHRFDPFARARAPFASPNITSTRLKTLAKLDLTRSRSHRTLRRAARVAELVDALDSESSVRKDVLVRLQSRAPTRVDALQAI